MYHLIKDSTQPTYMVNSFNPTFQNLSPKLYTTLHPISSGHSSLTHSKTKRNPLKSKVLEHSWLSNNGGVLQNMQAELPTFL